jgi:hypothetical protein
MMGGAGRARNHCAVHGTILRFQDVKDGYRRSRGDFRMLHRTAWRATALALTLLLAACAGAVQLTEAWRNDAYTGPKFTKVLVLGIGEDMTTRRVFEDSFSASLMKSGVQAVASYTVLPNTPRPTPDQLHQAALSAGADGALVTRLLRVEQKTRTSPGYVRAVPTWGYWGGGFYSYYNSMVMVTPPTTYTYDVATLETNLWSLQGNGMLVWSATSKSFTPDQVTAIGSELATEVSEALLEAGLIP